MELISSSAGGHAGNTQKYPHTHTHANAEKLSAQTDVRVNTHTDARRICSQCLRLHFLQMFLSENFYKKKNPLNLKQKISRLRFHQTLSKRWSRGRRREKVKLQKFKGIYGVMELYH